MGTFQVFFSFFPDGFWCHPFEGGGTRTTYRCEAEYSGGNCNLVDCFQLLPKAILLVNRNEVVTTFGKKDIVCSVKRSQKNASGLSQLTTTAICVENFGE